MVINKRWSKGFSKLTMLVSTTVKWNILWSGNLIFGTNIEKVNLFELSVGRFERSGVKLQCLTGEGKLGCRLESSRVSKNRGF